MTKITLQPGDIFCSANPWWIGRAICAVERFWAKDNDAEYGHGGIITDTNGSTLEAMWTVKKSTLLKYHCKPLLIARPIYKIGGNPVTAQDIESAINEISSKQLGRRYPIHRLLLHMVPAAAKLGTGDFVVCTELVAMYLVKLHILTNYLGINPDDLAEYLSRWNNFQVIFKGVFNGKSIRPGISDSLHQNS